MTRVPFDVFDVHHHVGRAFDALGGELDPGDDGREEFATLELADRLRIMDEGGVHQAMVIPLCGHNARCMFTADAALPVLFPKP